MLAQVSVNILYWPFLVVAVILGISLLSAMVKILREYERAVVFRLGRLLGAKGPGLILR